MRLGLFVLLAAPPIIWPCSMQSCIDGGAEMSSNFRVSIRFEGRPFHGATINITGTREVTGRTLANGEFEIKNLPPGDYWLSSESNGIGAGSQCFHVLSQPSHRARRRIEYTWGHSPRPVSLLAGRLTDSQPGTGPYPVWNQFNRITKPIAGATLTLLHPETGMPYYAQSGPNGEFRFSSAIPPGTYVFHIEGGTSGRIADPHYEPTSHLVRYDPKLPPLPLRLSRRETGCYNTIIDWDR